MNVGDSVPGNTRNETYLLKAGVAYQMGNWVIGLQGEYENQSLAKRLRCAQQDDVPCI